MGNFLKFWRQLENWIEVQLILSKKHHVNLGMLTHKKDTRDRVYLGGLFSNPSPKKEQLSWANHWRFNQKYLNICVFASNVIGSSYQEGKRFSVKFAVKMAVKNGDITGNGFSFLRAALNIAVNVGRLPYEMMPDEVNESWEDYSNPVDITQDMLDEAAKWKAPSYQKVSNVQDAIDLLDQGHVLLTGMTWYSGMNTPQPQNYYLLPSGDPVGGHAIEIPGYRAPGLRLQDFENPQTFGTDFANDGVARIHSIFASGFFDVYMLEKIDGRTEEDRAAGRYEGECVKGSGPAFYSIQNGLKCAVPNMDTFTSLHNHVYTIDDSMLTQIPDGTPVPAVVITPVCQPSAS